MMIDKKAMRKTYLLLGLTTLIWGLQPLFIKSLVSVWSAVTVTSMRYFIVGPVLILLSVWRGASFLPPLKSLPGLLLMGVVGIGFNNVLQFAGLGISTVINCTLIAAPRTGTYRFYGCGLSERTPECRCVRRDSPLPVPC